MSDRRTYRAYGALAVAGALLLVVGVWLHPSHANPNDAAAAFTEYAATGRTAWVVTHLIQLAGVAVMIICLVLLSRLFSADGWARAVATCGTATLALAATLQAVDGVALKAMVDRWYLASPAEKPSLFDATLAVRQVEIGLDALLGLATGVTIVLFGWALLAATARRTGLGIVAIGVGAVTAVAGVLIALDGYASGAMLATMAAGILAVAWMVMLGVWAWRRAPEIQRGLATVGAG